MRVLSLLLVTISLFGCKTIWDHPTKNTADYRQDAYACEKDSAAVQNQERANDMWNRCMRVKGWRPQ